MSVPFVSGTFSMQGYVFEEGDLHFRFAIYDFRFVRRCLRRIEYLLLSTAEA